LGITSERVKYEVPVDFGSEVKVNASTRNAMPGLFLDVSEIAF
jgi:hypothetical protein